MPRVEDGFRGRFRQLLAWVQPRRLEFGVELLLARGRAAGERTGQPLAASWAETYELTRRRVKRRLELTGACAVVRPPWTSFADEPPGFVCDASLAGLARWLHAAGYAARVVRGGFRSLLSETGTGVVAVTSDSAVFERRDVREGRRVLSWVPTTLDFDAQLRLVLGDYGLGLREPLCMTCGGRLVRVDKGRVAARIPPRTALWKQEYYLCASCDGLFWRGTHWERIAPRLAAQVVA